MSHTLQVCQNVDDTVEKEEAKEVLQSDDMQNSPDWKENPQEAMVLACCSSHNIGNYRCLLHFFLSTSSGKDGFLYEEFDDLNRITGSRIPQVFPLQSRKALAQGMRRTSVAVQAGGLFCSFIRCRGVDMCRQRQFLFFFPCSSLTLTLFRPG